MSKFLERLRNDFQGAADALIAKSHEVAKALNLDQEAAEGNERLLRHYVSIGVVDKPSREGRDALYGFRHLMQFVAARRLLAEGFPLAKIAKYTTAVPTDNLMSYLERQDRASEAELLVAAFRSEMPVQSKSIQASRRSPAPKHLSSLSTGMGMVDVMHEMREMEHRVRQQIDALQHKVHVMVDEALNNLSTQQHGERFNLVEFKSVVADLAQMMDGATRRFDDLLQKPMAMIEKQMEQQRFMFEEAYRQKDFLERIFGDLLNEQRYELQKLFDIQLKELNELSIRQAVTNQELVSRLENLESWLANRLSSPS